MSSFRRACGTRLRARGHWQPVRRHGRRGAERRRRCRPVHPVHPALRTRTERCCGETDASSTSSRRARSRAGGVPDRAERRRSGAAAGLRGEPRHRRGVLRLDRRALRAAPTFATRRHRGSQVPRRLGPSVRQGRATGFFADLGHLGPGQGHVTILPIVEGSVGSDVHDVNNLGQFVGYTAFPDGTNRITLYTDGRPTLLPDNPGTTPLGDSVEINDLGQVAWTERSDDDQLHRGRIRLVVRTSRRTRRRHGHRQRRRWRHHRLRAARRQRHQHLRTSLDRRLAHGAPPPVTVEQRPKLPGPVPSAAGLGDRFEALGAQGGAAHLARVVAQRLVDELDRARQLVARPVARRGTSSSSALGRAPSDRPRRWRGRALPRSSSGRPITAHECTAGCSWIAASTSAG